MATQLVQRIDAAQRQSWPEVKHAMDQLDHSIAQLSGVAEEAWPQVQDYINRNSGTANKRRRVCEETVWVLARLGWLRTSGEREVVAAARAWVAVDPDEASNEILAAIDNDLFTAVKALPEETE